MVGVEWRVVESEISATFPLLDPSSVDALVWSAGSDSVASGVPLA